jgi:hypothetical protein
MRRTLKQGVAKNKEDGGMPGGLNQQPGSWGGSGEVGKWGRG